MEQEICMRINKSALYHKRLMQRILEKFKLTYAQYQVLKVVQEHEGLTAKEVLVYLDSDKATLSGVLARLEKHQLITREINSTDRRLMHIYLTDKSKEFCSNIRLVENTCASDLTEGIKPKELKVFMDVFNRIIANQINKINDYENRD